MQYTREQKLIYYFFKLERKQGWHKITLTRSSAVEDKNNASINDDMSTVVSRISPYCCTICESSSIYRN